MLVGIGLQNFLKGAAVSVSLLREEFLRLKSFWCEQLSGIVVPIAGVIAAGGHHYATTPSLCIGIRCWSHDLCHCGGTCS